MLVKVRVILWVQRLVLFSNVNMSVNINRVWRHGSWRDLNVRISIVFVRRSSVFIKINSRPNNGLVSYMRLGGLGNFKSNHMSWSINRRDV
jgi:hypothetical protein